MPSANRRPQRAQKLIQTYINAESEGNSNDEWSAILGSDWSSDHTSSSITTVSSGGYSADEDDDMSMLAPVDSDSDSEPGSWSEEEGWDEGHEDFATHLRSSVMDGIRNMYTNRSVIHFLMDCLLLPTQYRYEVEREPIDKPPVAFLQHLLLRLKHGHPDLFWHDLCVTPQTFDSLVAAIEDDEVFMSRSELSPQAPVEEQLAVALYRFGHDGNASGLQSVANWSGLGKGTVHLYTR
ncbi:hypothetical protein K435DRAFT_865005 [Dendrothele bispora CBS 962.96]|uniref:Uncharacterized protein n=1 Tax=Dendrothele bispora (strain CBS 962.96) TaxID=1314807 RepID=A0A4S8LM00_DENBC|nr:hypothetical protein K435DRAFT_865005 [Dendrothele bispora CBS 962.96]